MGGIIGIQKELARLMNTALSPETARVLWDLSRVVSKMSVYEVAMNNLVWMLRHKKTGTFIS